MKGQVNISYVPDDEGRNNKNLEKLKAARLESGVSPSGEEVKDRDRAKWGGKWEFLMSCIAMSVGLGNIWRFPFTAYENGGGAFLIPYIITLLMIGRPLYYLEMILGQFTSKGNLQTFRALGPGFTGIGYGQLLSVTCVATYYCSLMALTLFYFFNSFGSILPWSVCEPEWINCINATKTNDGDGTNTNISSDQITNRGLSSAELYFTQTVLHEKTQISDGIGWPDWRLTLCLFVSWLCVLLVAVKGVKSSGKFSYFLALFPYVIMIAILIRAVTLPGCVEGILYFIRPKWEELLNPNVWYAAVSQCFFSLNIGFGSIIMYASYNDFNHQINRDAFIVSILDTCTSLLAGFTIFAILGNLAYELDMDVSEVVKTGGTGLAFISYPDAIAKFDTLPQLFAVLFFFMLFVLGVGSLVALQSCVATVIKDEFPALKNWMVATLTCLVGFLIGLVYVTPGGQFILTLVDYYAGTFNIYMMTIAEVIAIMWCYGLENICLDMQYMLGVHVNAYWRICWALLTPLLLIIILIYSLITMERLTYGSAPFPDRALACGWALLLFGISQIPIWVIWRIHKERQKGSKEVESILSEHRTVMRNDVSKVFQSDEWGPKDPQKYKEWKEFKERAWEERNNRNESRFKYVLNILLGR